MAKASAGTCASVKGAGADEFSLDPTPELPVVIPEGAHVEFTLHHIPTSGTGTKSAEIVISSSDPDDPTLSVDITGEVRTPDINVAIANSGAFGNVCQGDHADLTLTLFNQGQCNLNINNFQLVGDDPGAFSLPGDLDLPLVLSPDADFNLPVRFEPDSCTSETLMAAIRIQSDSPGETLVELPISGDSACPNLVIDPTDLEELYAFPTTVVDSTETLGCYSERAAVLRNNSLCPLTIDNITTSGPHFAVVAPTVFPIVLPGGEETLQTIVRFTPQSDADPLLPSQLTDVLAVTSNDPDSTHHADLCGESAQQSGVRILVTDVSSGDPVIVDEVDSLTVQSKGKSSPGPINLKFSDLAPSSTNVCGNVIDYHVNLETLPSTSTTGSNPQSSYQAKAQEGNLQTTDSFDLAQCEFRDAQLQLRDSLAEACLLLPKGASCTLDSQCCSGNCKGPSGGQTCK